MPTKTVVLDSKTIARHSQFAASLGREDGRVADTESDTAAGRGGGGDGKSYYYGRGTDVLTKVSDEIAKS